MNLPKRHQRYPLSVLSPNSMTTTTASTTTTTTSCLSSSSSCTIDDTTTNTNSSSCSLVQQQQQQQQVPSHQEKVAQMTHVPSSLATFERTIALNNAGANMMEKEDYSSAVKILERAFFTFKKAYALRRDELPSSRFQHHLRHFTNIGALFSGKQRRSSDCDCMQDETHTTETPLVYSNPIHLPNDFAITQESCGFLCTAVALNLAMSHHMVAVVSELSSNTTMNATSRKRKQVIHTHLTAAGRLYEYTIRLESSRARQYQNQPHQSDESSSSDQERTSLPMGGSTTIRSVSPLTVSTSVATPPSSGTTTTTTASTIPTLFTSPFALMVILNNSGHVHQLLQQCETSKRCYQRLLTACMYMMVRQQQEQRQQEQQQNNSNNNNRSNVDVVQSVGNTLITTSDLQFFLHNVNVGLHWSHRRCAPAA
ncbi:hypothetical protein IV203_006399 [Nitzschia inconspicua]|uniref:Uncharacterized protein n=1 Tax=Nitzschia inconspicua TaxID=303405 RepID=A0A9K3KAI3_9STRA|nr:hypothetical protein IV203_006399 [Nitzschia inconspicua]